MRIQWKPRVCFVEFFSYGVPYKIPHRNRAEAVHWAATRGLLGHCRISDPIPGRLRAPRVTEKEARHWDALVKAGLSYRAIAENADRPKDTVYGAVQRFRRKRT